MVMTTFRSYQPKHARTSGMRRILRALARRGDTMIKSVLAGLTLAAVLTGGATASAAPGHHTAGEIRGAAQSWADRDLPYSQLTPQSQRLITRSTWDPWARCQRAIPATASVRGHGNDLAVVRFSYAGGHTEWTAFYRNGQWTFELPGYAVEHIRTHTAAQLAHCR